MSLNNNTQRPMTATAQKPPHLLPHCVVAPTQAFLRQSISHDTRVSTNKWSPAVHVRDWEGTAPPLGSYIIVPEKRPAID
jgi:hypothetical protein